jgi:SAM-dependent methyltransferase
MTHQRQEPHLPDIEAWDQIALDYMQWLSGDGGNFGAAFQGLVVENVLPALGNVAGKTVLDLGCGEGYWASELAGKGARVIALDGSMKMLLAGDPARKNAPFFRVQGDLLVPLPFAAERVDIVLCNMVLMDLEAIDLCFAEAYKTLKPGGRFVFSIVHPCFYEAIGSWNMDDATAPAFRFTARYREQTRYEKQIEGLATDIRLAHYNRPIEAYLQALIRYGFTLTYFREPGFTPGELAGKRLPDTFNRYVFTANYLVAAGEKR